MILKGLLRRKHLVAHPDWSGQWQVCDRWQ